jgi:hypothetical protein
MAALMIMVVAMLQAMNHLMVVAIQAAKAHATVSPVERSRDELNLAGKHHDVKNLAEKNQGGPSLVVKNLVENNHAAKSPDALNPHLGNNRVATRIVIKTAVKTATKTMQMTIAAISLVETNREERNLVAQNPNMANPTKCAAEVILMTAVVTRYRLLVISAMLESAMWSVTIAPATLIGMKPEETTNVRKEI